MLSNTALLALPMADDVVERCRRRRGGEEEEAHISPLYLNQSLSDSCLGIFDIRTRLTPLQSNANPREPFLFR